MFVHRNLLFRARALSEEHVSYLTERILSTARAENGGSASVQELGMEAVLIALRATAHDGRLSVLSRYSELRSLIGQNRAINPNVQDMLRTAFESLLSTLQKFPAATFTIWSDLVALLPRPPFRVEAWVECGCSAAISLMGQDRAAAFVVWRQAVEWSHSITDATAEVALVTVAYQGIQKILGPGHEFNAAYWEYVKSANSARASSEAGRICSFAAALDLADYQVASRSTNDFTVLSDRMREANVVVGQDEKGLKLNQKAIEKNPTLVAIIKEFDHPVAEIVELANQWLTSDMIFHPSWNGIMSQLRDMIRRYGDTSPSLVELERRAVETARDSRRQYAQIGRQQLLVVTSDAIPWIDGPLVPLEWQEVDEQERILDLVAPLAIPGGPLSGTSRTIERVRTMRPSFYSDVTFVEVQTCGSNSSRGIIFCALRLNEQVVVFDGKASHVHGINAEGCMRHMNKPDVVLDYLMYFTHAVWGEGGPFRIVRGIGEIPLAHSLSPELEATVRQNVIERLVVTPDLQNWRVDAAVQYSNALSRATFEIDRKGAVEMLADEPLVTGLPVRTLTMVDSMRLFASNDHEAAGE